MLNENALETQKYGILQSRNYIEKDQHLIWITKETHPKEMENCSDLIHRAATLFGHPYLKK